MSRIRRRSGWKRLFRWFRWRGVALAAVFLCGLLAFVSGVGVSDRAGVATADLMTKVYYTLGLFVLGGMDLGVPQGGTWLGRGMLWAAYFLAPLLTASAVVEGVVRVVDPDSWRMWRIRDHVVVAGASDLSMLYLERLHETDPDVPIVLVEKRADDPHVRDARHRFGAIPISADIQGLGAMDAVRLAHAGKICLFTGDDFANLEAATKILELWPEQRENLVIHVEDLMLRRVLKTSELLRQTHIFNYHEFAATGLVRDRLLSHFRDTEKDDQLVLAGFGRFGQTVLDQIRRGAPDEIERVVIIDLEAERAVRLFDEHIDFARQYDRNVIEGDIRDPRVWHQVYEHIDLARAQPFVVVGSDSDDVNLQVALWLRNKFEGDGRERVKIVVRCFRNSTFATSLAEQCDFEVVSVADLVRAGLNAEWFPE